MQINSQVYESNSDSSDFNSSDFDSSDATEIIDDIRNPKETWKEYLLRSRLKDYLVNVDDSFISDEFNLKGIPPVPYYRTVKKILLNDPKESNKLDKEIPENRIKILDSIEFFYTRVHARYILTSNGLKAMNNFISRKKFGTCSRLKCINTFNSLIPISINDSKVYKDSDSEDENEDEEEDDDEYYDTADTYLYCPNCKEYFIPNDDLSYINGYSYGNTFCQFYLLQYSHNKKKGQEPTKIPHIEGRIFGYKVHKSSQIENNEVSECFQ